MELNGALRNVEPAGDLLVAKPLKHSIENFLLATADFHSGADGASRSQKLLGAFRYSLKKRLSSHDHDLEIFRRLATHQAMHGQQTCNLLDRHASTRFRIHSKSYSA